MENASKALIIAGAILLSILIISLGIIIYRQAAGIVNNNSMDEFETTTFNTKFTQYTGTAVRQTVVRSLIDQVQASNAAFPDHPVTIEGSGGLSISATYDSSTKKTTVVTSGLKATDTYDVEATEYSTNGYITKITVKLHTDTE